MRSTIVRHQAKVERAEENQRLIEVVFAEHDVDEPDSLQDVPALPGLRRRHRRALRGRAGGERRDRRRRLPVNDDRIRAMVEGTSGPSRKDTQWK
ncbi:MAG: hypothetical protein M3066_10855 [Actinomycetota bacterium]|nr:hypothetical protein [Actinomycetota bacterium]